MILRPDITKSISWNLAADLIFAIESEFPDVKLQDLRNHINVRELAMLDRTIFILKFIMERIVYEKETQTP